MPLVTTPNGDQVLLPDWYPGASAAPTPGTPMPSGPNDPGWQPANGTPMPSGPSDPGFQPPQPGGGDATQTAIDMVHRMWGRPPASASSVGAPAPVDAGAPVIGAPTASPTSSRDLLPAAYGGDKQAIGEIQRRADAGDHDAMMARAMLHATNVLSAPAAQPLRGVDAAVARVAARGAGAPTDGDNQSVLDARDMVARLRGDPSAFTPESVYAAKVRAANLADRAGQAGASVAAQAADDRYKAQAAALDDVKRMQADRDASVARAAAEHARAQQDVARYVNERDQYRVDPDQYWHRLGPGRQVGSIIAMALSGIGNALMGKGDAPNPVIQMMDAAAKQNVELQMDERTQLAKRADSAAQRMDAGDRFADAEDARRNADIARGLTMIQQQGDLAASKSGSALAQANWRATSAQLEQQKAGYLEQAAAQLGQERHQAAEEKIAQQNSAIAGGHLALASKQFEWTKDKDQQQLDLEAARLAQAGKTDEAKAVAERGVGGIPVEVKLPDGSSQVRYDVIKNRDGSSFVAATTDEAKAIRAQSDTTRRVVDAVDALRTIRNRSGWSSDTVKTDDWQRAHSEASEAILSLMESKGLKRLSETDVAQMKELLGNLNDPTRYKDIEAGLSEARKIAVRNLNSTLQSQPGFDGEVKFPDLVKAPDAPLTPDDAALENVLSDPSTQPAHTFNKNYGIDDSSGEAYQKDLRARGLDPENHNTASVDIPRQQPVPYAYKLEIDRLKYIAAGADGKATKAMQADAADRLRRVTTEAALPAVKQYAQSALYSTFGDNVPMSRD